MSFVCIADAHVDTIFMTARSVLFSFGLSLFMKRCKIMFQFLNYALVMTFKTCLKAATKIYVASHVLVVFHL